MKKAVIYARVSSREQEKEGYSIPAQIKLLNEYAVKKEFEVVREFIDSETAKKAGRTHFNEMLNYIKKHKDVNTILVEKTDRLYRNFKDYVTLDEFKGLEIHLVKENTVLSENSKSHEKLVHGFKVLMAKNYIDNLSEEIRKGQMQACEQGDYPSKPPYGYMRVNKNIVIDPDTSSFVLRAFSLYSQGDISLDFLRNKMLDDGFIYTDIRHKIGKSQLEKMLKNPFYAGKFLYKNVLYTGRHEPLISIEMFNNTAKAFKKDNKPEQCRRHQFLYSGLFKCAHCGSAVAGEIKKGKYIYYHCADKTKSCPNKGINLRQEDIDRIFDEAIKRIEITPAHKEAVVTALKASHEDESRYNKMETERLNKRAETLRMRLSKIYIDKLDGKITDEFWEEKHNEWTMEHAKVLQMIEAHAKADYNYTAEGARLVELLENLYSRYIQLNDEKKSEVIKIIFSNFFIDARNIRYEYNRPFDIFAKGLACTLDWRGRDSNPR